MSKHPSSSSAETMTPLLQVLSRGEHQISRKSISPSALKVLYHLNESGFQAFIVGGGVRDILLKLSPKDFDIATDATPEQVHELFRNSRIIGRRFRIVHVRYGREIIEVSTFRASTTDSIEIQGGSLGRKVKHLDSAHSESGMILRDNVFGDILGDVMRRDFTVNALYYTVQNFEVHDYLNSIEDIKGRTLRMIGDPEQRYREDPVRILRAIRLSAKLDFTIAEETEQPISGCAHLLESIPPARLFDEFLKLFFAGQSLVTYQKLLEYGVFNILFPETGRFLNREDSDASKLLNNAFISTDERINQGKSVTPAFLLAAILWPSLHEIYKENLAKGIPTMPAMHEAGQSVLSLQLERLSIPKRFSIPMREIWEFQLRLPRRNGSRAQALLGHKRFRAAYDFVLLREKSGEDLEGLGQWWTKYQVADKNEREKMQAQLSGNKRTSKPRRRRNPTK